MAQTAKTLGPDKTNDDGQTDKQNGGMVAGKKKTQQNANPTGAESMTEKGERGELVAVENGAEKRKERGGGEATAMASVRETAAAAETVRVTGREGERRELDKDLVVNVDVEGEDKISMMELLRAVDNTCGRVLGCRSKSDKRWELTMSNPKGKTRLLDGFKIRNSRVVASEVTRDTRIVSFLNLPLYVTDYQIVNKLEQWGVEPVSPIKRRKWAGTEVFDGTRFLKVRFNENVSSLPYSTRFDTLEGIEYFRVLHDNQTKVCRLCLQPGHILRECPEFKCFKCGTIGHYARECAAVPEADPQEETERDTGKGEEEGEEETGTGDHTGGIATDGEAEGPQSAARQEMEEESEVEEGEEEEEEEGGSSGVTAASERAGRMPMSDSTLAHGSLRSQAVTTSGDRSRSNQREGSSGSLASLPCGKPGQSGPLHGQGSERRKLNPNDSEWERVTKGKEGGTSRKGKTKRGK